MTINGDFYLKFPPVLKNALLEKKVKFGNVNEKYEHFLAFRAIKRENESKPIQLQDFWSYAEIGYKGRHINENDISYYGCSLFTNRSELKKKMKIDVDLQNSSNKIIRGQVKDSNGPCTVNKKTTHVDWWLFDGCDPSSDFEVIS
ncbi:hypothetical protein [Methanolapillus millepedarum]|uniref:Uncharacterized protein n=1 Tax=Methanolapillus millepedarum TaxID=3028296 RepID=A0AA96V2D3_9EURY|nr:hypothetical protein MsAc7_07430 [Methanosarcinaceae archaeon Ac7]